MLAAGVGVDGCRGGWVAAVVIDARLVTMRCATSFMALFDEVEALLAARAGATLRPDAGAHVSAPWLIDMPMGLTWDGDRGLEAMLRRELPTGRKSSVFPVPARAALAAHDYADACARNQQACGRKLSRQTWNIVTKIRELDDCLRKQVHVRERCIESHPEACFHALSADAALGRKRMSEGRSARLALLARLGLRDAEHWKTLLAAAAPPAGAISGDEGMPAWREPGASSPTGTRRAAATSRATGISRAEILRVAPDDALDAICLAFVASRPACWRRLQDPLRSHDELGLPLQLVLPAAPGVLPPIV